MITKNDYRYQKFYYDRLIKNRRLTMRLVDMSKFNKVGADSDETGEALIARAVIQPQYGFNIQNDYTGSSGLIDNIINSIGSAVTGRTGKLASEFTEKLGNLIKWDTLSNVGRTAGALSNSHIFSVSELVKAFKGTSVNFTGVDKMTIKLIADTEDTNLLDVVNRIRRYSIGHLYGNGEDGVEGDKDLTDITNDLSDTGIFNYIGIQGAPNNYKWTLGSNKLEERIDKTLTMFVGEFMIIDNLLITGLSVNRSSQTMMTPGKLTYNKRTILEDSCKLPNGVSIDQFASNDQNMINGRPAWVDIEITFEFARLVMASDLIKVFNL